LLGACACGGGGSAAENEGRPLITLSGIADEPAHQTTTNLSAPTAVKIASCLTAAEAGNVVVGHRGLPSAAPENTLASYRAAISAGAKWVETDAQITRDGAVVLMHDVTLDRTTNAKALFPARAPWAVRDFTLAEIRQLDAGSWYSPRFVGEKVPLLSELLEVLGEHQTGLLLELKSADQSTADRVAAVLESGKWVVQGRSAMPLCVNSFYLEHMKRFRALMPDVQGQMIFSNAPTASQLASARPYVDGILVQFTALSAPIFSSGDPLLRNLGVWTLVTDANFLVARSHPSVRIFITNDIKVVNKGLGLNTP
jgi:glycerophosphoryl diester phosphodiesterase